MSPARGHNECKLQGGAISEKVRECMRADGPKKILACDGGGILGLMSVEILARIEAELQARLRKPCV